MPHPLTDVEALPWLRAFSRSGDAAERAVFLRVVFDLFEAQRTNGRAMPENWTAALRQCLGRAPETRKPSLPESLGRQDVAAILSRGDLDAMVGLVGDMSARLRADQLATLIVRAGALAQAGDTRLSRALLARGPVRLEHAPLFLEADAEQRLSLLLAVQRAELGNTGNSPRELDPALAEPLEFAAIAGKREDFSVALAGALGVSSTLGARLAVDPGGEALVVALAALGAPRDLGVRVLTARDLSESADAFPRLHALARLAGQLSVPAARRLIAALAGTAVAQPALASPRREAETPSPFVRREAASATGPSSKEAAAPVARPRVTPKTSRWSAQNSRRP